MASKYDAQAKWNAREKERREAQPKPKKEPTSKMAKNDDFYRSLRDDMAKNLYGSLSFSGPSMASWGIEREPPKPAVQKPPAVTWDDVVGQAEAKAAMREAIEGATKHAALYKRYGRRPTKGILLYGPPGNGKTMLGKAAAGALSAQHGGRGQDSAFIYAKGSDILGMYLGESERKIRDLFARCRSHKASYGYPAVLFIDEAESVLSHRDEGSRSGITVPPFLAEMDGMTDSGALVLLATNRPNSLDSAIIREGRIDRKILVGRPTRDDVTALFARLLRNRPTEDHDVAGAATDALFDAAHVLYRVNLHNGGSKVVTLGCFTSGAQIAALVDAAASFAIDRELATGIEGSITAQDFAQAVERTLREQRDLDHPSELRSFCEPFMGSVVGLERMRADGVITGRQSLIAEMPRGMGLRMSSGESPPEPS